MNNFSRNNAEEALQKLNGTSIGKQTVRLSWGRNPANKQVKLSLMQSHIRIVISLLIYRNKYCLLTNNPPSNTVYCTGLKKTASILAPCNHLK